MTDGNLRDIGVCQVLNAVFFVQIIESVLVFSYFLTTRMLQRDSIRP